MPELQPFSDFGKTNPNSCKAMIFLDFDTSRDLCRSVASILLRGPIADHHCQTSNQE
jgi:hypothetical protein